nr:hypothetical protein LTR18_003396 [Exophiala xenobiotica]
MPQSTTPTDPAAISARSRRSSISGIPRPASGTSRRATPSGSGSSQACSGPGRPGFGQGQYPRKSWNPNDGAPLTSYRMPQSSSISPESLPPYAHRHQQDLSGVRQQLYIRNLSTKSLNDPDPAPLPQFKHGGGLPKSKTMTNLLSSPRDITPKRLLQPLGPPLPRTQTLGNITCFGSTNSTPSPRKPTSITVSMLRGDHDNGSQIHMADVLNESRMTDKEVELMLQVQREAAVNRIRLRNSIGGRHPASEYSSPPGIAQSLATDWHKSTPSITLPIKEAIPTRRLAGLQRKSSSGRLLSINPTIANNYCIDSDLPTATTVTSATGSSGSGPPVEKSKQVCRAESKQYWSGRYVSLSDRLRREEMQNTKPPSLLESTNRKLDQMFETAERARIRTSLKELRRCCMTEEALESFEDFEARLLEKLGIQHQSLYRAESSVPSDSGPRLKPSGSGGLRPSMAWSLPRSPGNTSTPTSVVSSINAEAVMTSQPNAFYGEGGMAKSKTTGNLASLIPTIAKRQRVPMVKTDSEPDTSESKSHRRKTSYFEFSAESQAQAMKEREARAARRAAETHRLSGSRVPSIGLVKSESRNLESQSLSKAPALAQKARDEIFGSKVHKFDPVMRSLDCAMLESGHGLPPTAPTPDAFSTPLEVITVNGGEEKVIKSRRRRERQLSGEMVKNFFGAGVREVRKMGRRVGAMSLGSSEDLLSPGRK